MPQNWMCHICWKCPPEKPSFPLFGWKGERGHATLFSFQPSPARLIKPGFTKNWEFWRPMWIWKKTDVYLREKPRGGFYRRQVIDFPEWVSIKLSHCSAQWEKINQTAVHRSGEKSTTAVQRGGKVSQTQPMCWLWNSRGSVAFVRSHTLIFTFKFLQYSYFRFESLSSFIQYS